jgi:hypothetical protein
MTGGLIVGGPGSHGRTLGLLLSASLLLLLRFNHELLALPLVATHHVGLNEPATAAQEGVVTRSRGCPSDGTRGHRTMAVAMDGGSGAGQGWLWTAQQRCKTAWRWCRTARQRCKTAWRRHGVVVLDYAGWSLTEVE